MLWKLLGLQKKLDALFCDDWVVLGYAGRGGSATHLYSAQQLHLESERG